MLPTRRFERSTGLFVALLVISILVATFDVREQGAGLGDTLREGAQTLFSPLQRVADAVTRPVVGFIDGISNIAGLREHNERLTQRVAELERERAEAVSVQAQLNELQEISDLAPPGDLEAVAARIVSSGVSDFDHIRWIDRGLVDGIVVGQAVTDEDGLVGRVDFVAVDSARVRLVSDPRMGVGVRDVTTRETGWVEGQGADSDGPRPLTLKMFNAVEPVREGDVLETDGTRFPAGIRVGTVRETAEAEVGFQLISRVDPAVNLTQVDFVKVIVGWSPLDASGPEDEPAEEAPPLVTQ